MKNGKAALWIILSLLFAGRALAAPDESAVEKGRQVYQKWCQPCHGDGVGKPGTDALAEYYKGKKPAVLDQRTDLTPEMIRLFVRRGVLFMPSFRKTEVSDAELAAISAYLTRNNKPKP